MTRPLLKFSRVSASPNAFPAFHIPGWDPHNWQKDFVYWAEVHTAHDKEVQVVLDKLPWLKNWLVGELRSVVEERARRRDEVID